MPARKIQDEGEIARWFEEGRTYEWMVDEYLRKYNIEVVPSLFGNFRRRRGLSRRIVRDDELIPWSVKQQHRHRYEVVMLRVLARERAGAELRAVDRERLRAFKARLAASDSVIHYDPDTERGFSYVPRREDTDTDVIREPATGERTTRPAADRFESPPR